MRNDVLAEDCARFDRLNLKLLGGELVKFLEFCWLEYYIRSERFVSTINIHESRVLLSEKDCILQ
jgi:hypothetical protein